ncbi:MAG: hypothetical protein PHZ09_08900 [Eubacteriales bacterium]|nr:hypothetical protein [Eubacteriales bacterium]
MKRTPAILVTALLALSLAFPVSAALFTDFDGYKSFNAGGNPVYNAEDPADYWVGAWDSGELIAESGIAIEEGKGFEGSKGLALWEDGTSNQGLYLFVTAANAIPSDYTGAVYLRVWMDLTDVGFRKANFGVSDSGNNLYSTDEENANAAEWPFYYCPEGATAWETYLHGGDGCFGDGQDSDVAGFKGWFAFPVSDFVIRSNANWDALEANTPAPMNDVKCVYLFWDYSDYLTGGDKFYLDNIEFVTDYTVFEVPEAVEEVIETAPAAEATADAPVETVPAAQTADTLSLALMGTIAALAFGIIKKRR